MMIHRNLPFLFVLALFSSAYGDSVSDNPIVFVTMVPNPSDFGTHAATFGNHVANPDTAFRGGDLWIRYLDGSLKNLTQVAGYGNSGLQGANSIAVRDPSVHWDGNKVIFSMVIGAPTQRYQVNTYRWQLYQITGLQKAETPIITKIPNQPAFYNNLAPTYGSDDSIIFTSDRPRDESVFHTYPQRDEYESSPVTTGIWKLTPSGEISLLDHAPSGDFNPIVDSFGRVIFTRWDHLQRDQQNIGGSFGAFNYENEASTSPLLNAQEVYPEPRSAADPDKKLNTNLFTINQFFPWMVNQDGTDLETLNHIGRQEIGNYSERSFNDDPNVEEFYSQYKTGANQNPFTIFLHLKEFPSPAGTYIGTSCQEFGTHAAGQIITLNGPPGMNPDAMQVSYLTHPDTSGASDTPSINHSGLYRDPLPLSNGKILVSHTFNARQDANIGTSSSPLSRYDFRLKLLTPTGSYQSAGSLVTTGVTKSVSFWSPDNMINYNGLLWEMNAVELRPRSRPVAHTGELPAVESRVLANLGITLNELKEYLTSQKLALVVSRNITTRDRNDRQQPINLRVAGGGAQSIPKTGKIYDVSSLQIFQGDLIRGYNSSSSSGRRVLAQPMHSVPEGLNIVGNGASPGSVQIAEDGSVAAFVPARRALSWQLASPSGEAVVRERYWLTFQPGEVRVCASCHALNTSDHASKPEPVNEPLALVRLLSRWKNLPVPTPTNTPGGGGDGGGSGGGGGNNGTDSYLLTLTGMPNLQAGKSFTLIVSGGTEALLLRAKIVNQQCSKSFALRSGQTSRTIRGKLPSISGRQIQFSVYKSSSVVATTKGNIRGRKAPINSYQDVCSRLFKSLKQ